MPIDSMPNSEDTTDESNTTPEVVTLTQYGRRTSGFRCEPRADEPDVSLLLGQLTADEARILVVPWGHTTEDDMVRYALADCLRDKGFTICLTPSRMIPGHVSVEYEGEWNDDMCEAFDECFTEPEE